jgi:hypothetical protein
MISLTLSIITSGMFELKTKAQEFVGIGWLWLQTPEQIGSKCQQQHASDPGLHLNHAHGALVDSCCEDLLHLTSPAITISEYSM